MWLAPAPVVIAPVVMVSDPARLGPTLVKVLLPLATIAAALVAAHRLRLGWRAGVGLRRPPAAAAVLWFAAYVLWMLGTNAWMGWRGPWDFAPWARTPLPVAMLRVLAVGILGPIAEELLVRGVFYGRLVRTRLGATRAGVAVIVALLAAGWAIAHTAYTPGVIGVIFVAGLLLGAARAHTGSVVVPMVMHVAWNLYAVW